MAAGQGSVLVNREPVTQEQFAQQYARYGIALTVTIPDGAYWYDPASGLWGLEGGPSVGQMPPDLQLGGPLRADASLGGTGVFINAREIHLTEALFLQQLFGYVMPGRYWMNAMGIGGPEGGPAMFSIAAAIQQRSGGAGYNRQGPFGSMGSDGECAYYMAPGGESVMTGNC
jgi:hypothetical protein